MPATRNAEVVHARLMVGLEIHIELATRSKMFTRVASPGHPEAYDREPNELVDPVVAAPVLSQPSLPMGKKGAYGLDISREDLDVVKGRCANEDLQVLGLRFKSDRFVPAARFQFLRDELGDAFTCVELEDTDANPDALIKPHSVLTEHFVDQPDSATHDALDQVLDLFRRKLLAP